jgi:hypothetical protein
MARMNPLLASWLIAVSTNSAALDEFKADPARSLAAAGITISAEVDAALRSADPRTVSLALLGSVEARALACNSVVGEPEFGVEAPISTMCAVDLVPGDDPSRG